MDTSGDQTSHIFVCIANHKSLQVSEYRQKCCGFTSEEEEELGIYGIRGFWFCV